MYVMATVLLVQISDDSNGSKPYIYEVEKLRGETKKKVD